MKALTNLAIASTTFSLILLGGCATGHVDPSERDTTGAYDGIWVGSVDEPRASRELLPGNWYMNCEWEPHEVYLVVDDGRVQLGKLEGKTPVSKKGDFRIDVNSGAAGMQGGVMPGNPDFIQIFSGNLAGSDPRGKYMQLIGSMGGNGCSARIRFKRYSEPAA